jgi:hypothetical protein
MTRDAHRRDGLLAAAQTKVLKAHAESTASNPATAFYSATLVSR